MEDRTRTLAAVAIIVGFLVLVIIIVGVILTRKNLISPIPEEGVIKIIFVSPTPQVSIPTEVPASPSAGKKS